MFHRLADDGTAVLVSSHVMDEAERCDRLLLMRDGVLLATESPGDLLARTRTTDVEDAFLTLVEGAAA
jgi:ABC-2 type transport system ATP-binding protein